MFGFIGAPELIIILIIVLLVFGSTQLPRLARSLGQAQKEYKKGASEGDTKNSDEDTKDSEESTEPTESKE